MEDVHEVSKQLEAIEARIKLGRVGIENLHELKDKLTYELKIYTNQELEKTRLQQEIEPLRLKLKSLEAKEAALKEKYEGQQNQLNQFTHQWEEMQSLQTSLSQQTIIAKDRLRELKLHSDRTEELSNELKRIDKSLEESLQLEKDIESQLAPDDYAKNASSQSLHEEYQRLTELHESLLKRLEDCISKHSEYKSTIENIQEPETPLDELYDYIRDLREENDIIQKQIEAKDKLIQKYQDLRLQHVSDSPPSSISSIELTPKVQLSSSLDSQEDNKVVFNETYRHLSESSKGILRQQEEMIKDLESRISESESLLEANENTVLGHLSMIQSKVSQRNIKTMAPKSEKEGYLVKQGIRFKTWKRRYFFFSNQMLYYAKKKESRFSPIGSIPLHNITVKMQDIEEYPYLITISTPNRFWYLRADNQDDREEWYDAIREFEIEETKEYKTIPFERNVPPSFPKKEPKHEEPKVHACEPETEKANVESSLDF